VLNSIYALILEPNADDPLVPEIAQVWSDAIEIWITHWFFSNISVDILSLNYFFPAIYNGQREAWCHR
jgi:hypothetical protein